jgi:hypothetical protein
MEVRRRAKKNKLFNLIRDVETLIDRNKTTIKRIKNSQMGAEYVKAQIVKLKDINKEKEQQLEILQGEYKIVSSGKLDEKINDEYESEKKIYDEKCGETDRIRAIKKEENKENKVISKTYWKNIISTSKANRQHKRDMRYGLKYFNRVSSEVPGYMKKNLSRMPSNKGYIWRGVWLFGEGRRQSGPSVMFEKKRGGILVIHEYYLREYRRYEKKGKERKKLVHKKRRVPKNTGTSLMDYVKR